MVPRLASISGCSYLNLLSAEITSMGHHAQQAPLLGEARATSCTSIALFHALNLEFTHIPILIVAISVKFATQVCKNVFYHVKCLPRVSVFR